MTKSPPFSLAMFKSRKSFYRKIMPTRIKALNMREYFFGENFWWILGRVKIFKLKKPKDKLDELLFQEPTTKISAPNSKYYG
jgi:hypothetical protein